MTDTARAARWLGWPLLAGALTGALAGNPAQAQTVSLVGLSAGRALLVIDGAAPRFLAPGQTQAGVRLLSLPAGGAVVEVQGERRTLQLGAAPMAAQAVASPRRPITLLADAGGHFTTQGQINGQAVTFLVDTGATVMTLSETQARRIGLPLAAAQRVRVKTANGEIAGHQVSLNSVQLDGHTSHGVAAVVLPADLPYVLLGNSFLARFALQRDGGRMTLTPQY